MIFFKTNRNTAKSPFNYTAEKNIWDLPSSKEYYVLGIFLMRQVLDIGRFILSFTKIY